MRLALPLTLIVILMLAQHATAAPAVEPGTSLARQLALYHTLQQRIAKPGEASEEGVAGLQLLLAQLYSELGMLSAAKRTLDQLEGGASIRELRDMGRLLLARHYRQRGEIAASEEQLQAISSQLDQVLENERQMMLALSALEHGAADEALRRFGAVQGAEGAVLLARFNYAALLLQGRSEAHAVVLLQTIAAEEGEEPAVATLRDRANLLLGYHFLQQQGHEEARHYLQQVTLRGPYSRAALLALGWAELTLRGAEYAMVPWMELLSYGTADSLDEEAQLAIAAAMATKGPSLRVIEQYQRLLGEYEQGREALNATRQRHATPYAPGAVEAVLQGEPQARDTVAGVELARLLALRQQLFASAEAVRHDGLDESRFYDELWPQLHALYPAPDGVSGVGVVAYVARRTESFIHSSLQNSPRKAYPASDLAARIEADRGALEEDISLAVEWYRRTRLAQLQAHDERLVAYMERARLAIARNHELALRRQESE